MNRYQHPRTALFWTETGIYHISEGWIQEPKQAMVIGEDHLLYITEVREVTWEEWEDGKTVEKTHHIPIGFAKSRLIQWVGTQLQLNLA